MFGIWQAIAVRARACMFVAVATWFSAVVASVDAQSSAVKPVEGLRKNDPDVFALTGARLVVAPGREIPRGVIVVRDGRIQAIGENVQPPAEARIVNVEGRTIYAGLVDAFTEQAVPDEALKQGAPHWSNLITPQASMSELYRPDGGLNGKLRGQGFVARLVAPASGIFKGTSALVVLDDTAADRAVVRGHVAQHLKLTLARGQRRGEFPNSPMGAVALARQTLLDAAWYRASREAARADSLLARPETNDALAALESLAGSGQLVIADASDEQFFLRADQFAREFSFKLAVRGSGREYRRLDAIRATGRTVLVPVDFPQPPHVVTAEAATNAALDDLLHWDFAPENPARLERAGVRFAFMSHGLKEPAEFLARVRKAVKRGLSRDAALRALTTTPAELFGADESLGTLAAGKSASFVVTSGDLFDDATKIVETWVAGRRYEYDRPAPLDVRGDWKVDLSGPSGTVHKFSWKIDGEALKPRGEAIVLIEKKLEEGAKPEPPAEHKIALEHVVVADGRFGAMLVSEKLGRAGKAHFSGSVTVAADGSAKFDGELRWPDGTASPIVARREPAAASKPAEPKPADAKPEAPKPEGAKPEAPKPTPGASFDVNFPLGAFGRAATPDQPKAVVFRNATLWTCGAAGKIEYGSLAIGDGKILAVGRNDEVTVPAGAVVVDLKGAHVSPGIIDCHSHMATDGGVNESSQAITAEVRIGDFIDATDITIYRQLAGGVTSAHILHGSANPIGGQCQLIKLRWGSLPEELKFREAPPTIKFALGENVKQSNWGAQATGRYPQSRMGVDEIMRDAFQTAREYRQAHERWTRERRGLPPRRDLELEAIVEILEARRWIHCHSYRQDEILAFLRAMEAHQVRVATLQHILEGYKVADVIARHGAAGSAFSDWWSYKFEVFDSIPYNASLMHDMGIIVSINSDDRELARHLNHEAAKAVKYGGVPEVEALKFVTLNPARQLMVDKLVGSLEVGKHADFVVWNGSPLSTLARCEQTWVDGRKYFDRADDKLARQSVAAMRATLVQKVLGSGEGMRDAGESYVVERDEWVRDDEFCQAHPYGHELRVNGIRLAK